MNTKKFMEIGFRGENENYKFDVFICDRRSTGSQFARHSSLWYFVKKYIFDNFDLYVKTIILAYIIIIRRKWLILFFSFLLVKLENLRCSVFIDVKCLGAGNYDNNLQQNVKRPKNFMLVLTPDSSDRCVGDSESKDWMHKVNNRLRVNSLSRWRRAGTAHEAAL